MELGPFGAQRLGFGNYRSTQCSIAPNMFMAFVQNDS
jgi:hypothetical protein